MKKVFKVVCFCLLSSLVGFSYANNEVGVESVDLAIAQGGSAVYDWTAQTITWSGGASGSLGLVGGGSLDFDSGDKGVTITGNVLSGTPSGSEITLSDLSLELFFSPYGQTEGDGIHLFADLSAGAVYHEVYSDIPFVGQLLSGDASVDVWMTVDDPSATQYEWVEPTGSLLQTTLLDIGDFSNYEQQSYDTDNMVLTITAVVPEPATMALLACGAVGVLVKRRKK